MDELKQIETMTLRNYIDQEMTKLRTETLDGLSMPMEQVMENMTEIMNKTARLIALQEIAYRLEYGFIVEMGNTSLKKHLTEPI